MIKKLGIFLGTFKEIELCLFEYIAYNIQQKLCCYYCKYDTRIRILAVPGSTCINVSLSRSNLQKSNNFTFYFKKWRT